jgi:hypothetical protein
VFNNPHNVQPPQLGIKLLEMLLSEKQAEYLIGCLEEDWTKVIKTQGVFKSRIWFWKDVIRSILWMFPNTVSDRSKDLPLRHIATSSALYAFLHCIALHGEIAYRYDRFGATILKITPFVFLWIFGASLINLWVGCRLIRKSRNNSLLFTISLLAVAEMMLYAGTSFVLPRESIIVADFPALTAHASYLKNIIYIFPLGILFLIIPVHFVVSIKKELESKNPSRFLTTLSGISQYVVPAGSVYMKVSWLWLTFFTTILMLIPGTLYLWDNLQPNKYLNFFISLRVVYLLIYITFIVNCLIWYKTALGKIKQELLSGA